jgi:hypothetical protein
MTTEEEMEAFHIVKAILRQKVDPKRVAMRDQQSYCGILLDDNNRRPLCRLWFNRSKKQIGLFDNEQRKEEKLPIASLDELYQYADRLQATLDYYSNGNSNSN